MTPEELDHELGHLATDEKWGWIAEPIEAELTRLRAAMRQAADVCHGGTGDMPRRVTEARDILLAALIA